MARYGRAGLLATALALVASWPPGSARAAQSCIQTYDRSGAVTGRYCADGLVDPGGPNEAQSTGEAARRPRGPAPGVRAAPAGGEIRCDGRNGRCRGTFSLR